MQRERWKDRRRVEIDGGEKRAQASTSCWERGVTSVYVGSTVSLVTNLTHVESSARDRSVSLSTIVCPRSTGLSNSVRVIGGRQSAGIRWYYVRASYGVKVFWKAWGAEGLRRGLRLTRDLCVGI